jgi:hypothetical protein
MPTRSGEWWLHMQVSSVGWMDAQIGSMLSVANQSVDHGCCRFDRNSRSS